VLQHLPASYRHAVATCRAPIVEDRLLNTPSYLSQLRMSYCLPPQYLGRLWGHVLAAVSQAALGDFRHPELFVAANGTKLQFKYPGATSDLLAVMQTFDFKIRGVLNFSHVLDDRLYLDVGKETCPMDGSPGERPSSNPPRDALVYLWCRCSLNHHLGQLYDGQIPKSGQAFYHESIDTRDILGYLTCKVDTR
jgi:hypothetical protein